MTREDRDMFFFNLDTLDWQSFILYYVLGTREFVLKQDPSTIPACKRKLKFLYICDRIVKFIFLYLLYKLLSFIFF